MNRKSARLSAIGAAVVAAGLVLAGCGAGAGSGGGTAGSGSGGGTDATVVGVKITKDAKIAAMLPSQYQSGLRFATSAPYAPWESFNSSNQLVGLDIDTGRAVSAVLGVPYSITSLSFNGLIPAVQAGKYDVITSSMSDTREREQIVSSVDYSETGNVLIVQAGNPHHITGLSDLCGQTVARQTGDVFGALIDSLQGPCKAAGKQPVAVKTFPSTSAALLALKSGIVQVQIAGQDLASQTVSAPTNKGAFQIVAPPKSLPYGWSPQVGGAQTLKSDTQLTNAIAAAVQKLMDDGTLKKIFEKYGMSQHLMPKVLVNHPNS